MTFKLSDEPSRGADGDDSSNFARKWEQVLQSLLLERGVLEDLEVRGDSASSTASPVPRRRPLRSQSDGRPPTLAELRRMRPLANLGPEAQTALLTSRLCSYSGAGGDSAAARLSRPSSPQSSSAKCLPGALEAEEDEEGTRATSAPSTAPPPRAVAEGSDAGEGAPSVVRYQLDLDAVAVDESLARSARRAVASRNSVTAPYNISIPQTARTLESARTVDQNSDAAGLDDTDSDSDVEHQRSDSSEDLEGDEDAGEASLRETSHNYRLALENLAREAIDEGVARGARVVLEVGGALSGRKLSDEELRALPQVSFDRSEDQTCAICLEAYKKMELLTALKCGHFFHVDCLTGWFQQTNKCPLCRSCVT